MRFKIPILVFFSFSLAQAHGFATYAETTGSATAHDEQEELRQQVRELALRVTALEAELHKQRAETPMESASLKPAVLVLPPLDVRSSVESVSSSGVAEVSPVAATTRQAETTQSTSAVPALPTALPGGATLNYMLDAYYEYDFNHPIGRIQYLRAYDVLSNAFSINQADVVFDWTPNVEEGRRYGMRMDLQFGQATDTLQGNPSNEVRPQIYRNIFQAYGTYVVPLGNGLTVNFGKWASSVGIEGNYTKDQVNYSRSFFFDYLPAYHMGVHASYKVNDRLALNYWLVNGTNQTEPTNSYKDELFGFTAQPTKNISWTTNYYVGQDHPDVSPATNCTVPLQVGLCVKEINPAPDGKAHMFDSYATWNASPKLTFSAEGDYVISREWANAAPGQSSAPSLVAGGAAYARYQLNPKMALGGRFEYFNDRNGLFSGTDQALKEFTGTYDYLFGEGFLARAEFRRDWSNVPYFLTNKPGVLSPSQPTFTVGVVWWAGRKQGAW